MKTIRRKKLIFRLLIFLLPLLILSIILTGVILSWTGYNYSLKTIDQDYRNIIKSSAGEIRLYMKNAQKNLEGLALVMTATKLDPWQKEMALTAFNHTAVEFMSVALISAEGEDILSIGGEGDTAAFGQSETFKKARSGQNAISGIMWTKENIPYIHMAVPVRRLGVVSAVLWGELNLKSVWDVLEGIQVGRTGRISIMDLMGRYVGHRQIDQVVNGHSQVEPAILASLYEPDTLSQWVEKRNGIGFYCLGYHIPGLDWIVVLEQAYPEIHAYLYQNIYWAVLITCLICIVAILLGWNRIKHFLVPIHDLHTQVLQISQGNLDQKVSVASQDEIGDLGLAFNEMTDAIKRLIHREVETARELAHTKNLAVLGTTSSKVTHEVGNLLNNVGLTLSTLKREKLSRNGIKAVEITEKDAIRVRGFIQNFLQFAKAPELKLENVSLEPILREIIIVQKQVAEKKDIHLELDWPSDLPLVNIDPRLMNQVFDNLIKNSLEAMSDPGSIHIKGRVHEDCLSVILTDSGPGMEPNVVDRIFDPFFTTKGKKGTGLGLSIVRTIVETHRGTITCMSTPREGTTFTLNLRLQ